MKSHQERRFRVTKKQEVIHVAGSITDTTDCRLVLADLTNENWQEYSLEGMLPSTWIGLLNFYQTITHLSKNVMLDQVPEETFRHLKIIDFESNRLRFKQVCVRKLQSGNDTHLWCDLEKVTSDSKGFATFEDIALVGSGHSINPRLPMTAMDEKVLFFLSYAQFLHATFDFGGGIIFGLELEILEITAKLKARAAAYDEAFSNYYSSHQTCLAEIENFEKHVIDAFEAPKSMDQAVNHRLQDVIVDIQTKLIAQENSSFDSFQQLVFVKERLNQLSQVMEKCGVGLGKTIENLKSVGHFRQSLSAIRNLKLEGDQLEDFRDAFEIMDPDSEDSWFRTIAFLDSEIDGFSKMIGDFVITLQGFDLARQILEHRIDELASIESFDQESEYRKTIHEKIAAKLVTDQESHAYGFFFPIEKKEMGDRGMHEPGDMMLF